MDNVTILRVDTGEAVQSVNDLRQNIKILKDQLGQLEIGTKDYENTLGQLKTSQDALRKAMSGEAVEIDKLTRLTRSDIDATTGLARTYNGLVEQMANLRKTQRDVNISTAEGQAEYERMAAEINRVNDRLKELDALNGNHQRNVGNYTSGQVEVVDNFKKLREEIKRYRSELLGLEEGTEEYNLTMQKLADAQFKLRDANETARWSANDLGERLSTTARVADGLIGGFYALENAAVLFGGNVEELEKAFYKLQVAASIVQGIQGLEGLTKDIPIMIRQFKAATSGVTAFTAGLSGMQKALMATGIGILISALGLLIANWDKLVAVVNRSTDETDSYRNSVDDLQTSFKSFNNELDLNIQLMEAEGATQEEIVNKRREAVRQQLEETQALMDSMRSKGKLNEGEREQLDRLIATEGELYDTLEKLNTQALVLEVRARTKKKSEEEEIQRKMRLIEAEQQLASLNVEVPEKELKVPEMDFSGLTENPDADALLTRQQAQLDALEGMTDRRMRLAAIATQDEEANALEQIRIQEEANARKLALLQQFEEQAYSHGDVSAAVQWQQQQADLELEIAEETYAKEKAIRDKAVQDEVERRQRMSAIMQSSAGAISSILTSVADAYEASAGDSEAAAERVKGIRIASATIDTIAGAVGAFMGITRDTGGWGIALAAIQAAAVMAAGIAQIQQIRNTDVSGGSSSSPSSGSMSAVVPAPTLDTEIPTVRNLTGASEEDRLNRMAGDQRVYILSSDIEASQNSRRVQVRESTF